MPTARSLDAAISSRATASSSSCGAVCASAGAPPFDAGASTRATAGRDGASRRLPRRRRRDERSGVRSRTGAAPTPARARYDSRRNVTPRLAATSPTASNAWSSVTIWSTSPGRAAASHAPADTAIRRSLQSRTPTDGALWTRCAPRLASRRAVSWPMTRQLPTPTSSVAFCIQSSSRCARTRAMCSARLVFSTSKNTAHRRLGSGAGGRGGGTRAAKSGSTATTGVPSRSSAGGSAAAGTSVAVTDAGSRPFRGRARRPWRPRPDFLGVVTADGAYHVGHRDAASQGERQVRVRRPADFRRPRPA